MFSRKLRNNNRNRKGLAFVLAFIVMMSMLTMGAIFDIETTKVTFAQKDNFEGTEKTESIVTTAKTVEEFLEEQKIILGEDDVLNVELSTDIYPGQEITLEKSKLVGICLDGKTSFERTKERTVGNVLEEKNIGQFFSRKIETLTCFLSKKILYFPRKQQMYGKGGLW